MDVNNLSKLNKTIVGIQFLFVAFGATVIVPLLIGVDPALALLSAGIGTLLFHLITKGKVPVYLGSSFIFVAPIITATAKYGFSGMLSGIIAVGLVYIVMGSLIKFKGVDFIKKLFPPIVVGPVIMLIGLTLAPIAMKMADTNWILAGISLSVAVLVSLYGHGIFKLIPIFVGVIVGYIVSILFFDVDTTNISLAPWFSLPKIVTPTFSWEAMIFMIPVAIAPVIEHIGDIFTISAVANKDFVKSPGLHRTMFGDGVACIFAGFVGGPPLTTYSEVTGAISLTKITNPAIIRISAVSAIVLSMFGKISAILQSIPEAVLGGIMLLLFGSITSVGVSSLLKHKVDLEDTRNMIIVSLILTFGVGGMTIQYGNFTIEGIGFSALLGIILNLVLPKKIKK